MTHENNFQIWLDLMDERILELKDMLPREISEKLDFSYESLNSLERYLLQRFDSIGQIRQESENNLILGKLARYFGEVVRKNVEECYWFTVLDNKKHVYFQLPSIYVSIQSI